MLDLNYLSLFQVDQVSYEFKRGRESFTLFIIIQFIFHLLLWRLQGVKILSIKLILMMVIT